VNNELAVCTAAFFRNKGKDVITVNELIMTISLDYRWMDTTAASRFVKLILKYGLVTASKDNLLKASGQLSEIDIPVAYRPTADLIKFIKETNMVPEPTKTPSETKQDTVTKETPKKIVSAPTNPVKEEKPVKRPTNASASENQPSLLSELMNEADKLGLKRGAFIAECNKIVKSINVDTEVAGLIVLRDRGADVSPYFSRVYSHVSGN
jgi:hypothetical protein